MTGWLAFGVLLICAGCGRLGFDDGAAPNGDAPIGDARAARPRTPIHDYRLAGNLSDARGGPSLENEGGVLMPTGYQFPINAGLALRGAVPEAVYTIDLEIAFDTEISPNGYLKIIDFKDLTADEGLYALVEKLQFVRTAGNGDVATSSLAPFTPGAVVEVTLTRDAGDAVSLFVNKAFQVSITDPAGAATFSATAQIAHFADDDHETTTEATTGTLHRITIWDVALDQDEVAALAFP